MGLTTTKLAIKKYIKVGHAIWSAEAEAAAKDDEDLPTGNENAKVKIGNFFCLKLFDLINHAFLGTPAQTNIDSRMS